MTALSRAQVESLRPGFEVWLPTARNIDNPNVSLRRWTHDDGTTGDYSNRWARAYFAGYLALAEHALSDESVERAVDKLLANDCVQTSPVGRRVARETIIAALGLGDAA